SCGSGDRGPRVRRPRRCRSGYGTRMARSASRPRTPGLAAALPVTRAAAGRTMEFGPQRGPWADDGWIGWWGEDPPFHTPVVVLTHAERVPLTAGETTFPFLDASPTTALARALELADGQDVRIGGGVTTVREFLDADLIDELHVAIAPIEYG